MLVYQSTLNANNNRNGNKTERATEQQKERDWWSVGMMATSTCYIRFVTKVSRERPLNFVQEFNCSVYTETSTYGDTVFRRQNISWIRGKTTPKTICPMDTKVDPPSEYFVYLNASELKINPIVWAWVWTLCYEYITAADYCSVLFFFKCRLKRISLKISDNCVDDAANSERNVFRTILCQGWIRWDFYSDLSIT